MQNISGRRFGQILEAVVLVIISLLVSFVYSWQITLIALAYFPVVIVAGAFNVGRSFKQAPMCPFVIIAGLMFDAYIIVDDAIYK